MAQGVGALVKGQILEYCIERAVNVFTTDSDAAELSENTDKSLPPVHAKARVPFQVDLGFGLITFSAAPDYEIKIGEVDEIETLRVALATCAAEARDLPNFERPSTQPAALELWREGHAVPRQTVYEPTRPIYRVDTVDDPLNLRSDPVVTSEKVAQLESLTRVYVLERTGIVERIGGHRGEWVYIQTVDGRHEGYVFGYYLTRE